MARADTVSLTYTADIADLKKKLAEIPDITAAEARKAVNELTRTNKAILKASKQAAGSTRNTSDALKDLGDTAGDSESSLRAMGGVLGLISPQAERAVAMVAELGGGLEGVTKGARLAGVSLESAVATMGIVGAAVLAAGAAYTAMTGEMERAAQHAQFLADVNASLEPSVRRLEDAQLALAAATGAVSAAEAEATARSLDAQRAVLDFAKAQRAQREELAATVEENQRYLDGLQSLIGPAGRAVEYAANAVFGFSDSIEQANGELAYLDQALQREAKNQKDLRDLLGETKDAEDASTESTKRHTAAIEKQTVSRSQMLRAMAQQQQAAADLATLQEDLAAGGDTQARAELAVNREFERRVALLDKIAEQVGYNDEVAAAFTEAQIAREEQIQAIRDANIEATRAAERAASEERAQLAANDARNMQNAYATLAGGIADAAGAAAAAVASENKGLARGLFAAQKAASIAQAIINGAIAKTRALAVLGPVAGPIAAAGITASVAAQVAVITAQKPSFNDTPGVVQLPGGGGINLAPGDMAVAGKNLDDMAAQVDRARDRSEAPTVQVVAIPSYRGRTYERARRDAYRRPGADYDALNRDRANGPGGW